MVGEGPLSVSHCPGPGAHAHSMQSLSLCVTHILIEQRDIISGYSRSYVIFTRNFDINY